MPDRTAPVNPEPPFPAKLADHLHQLREFWLAAHDRRKRTRDAGDLDAEWAALGDVARAKQAVAETFIWMLQIASDERPEAIRDLLSDPITATMRPELDEHAAAIVALESGGRR